MDFDLLDKYEETFGEGFPLMEYRSASNERINSLLKECLSKDKPITEIHPIDYKDDCY